jgi:hypothetical protein
VAPETEPAEEETEAPAPLVVPEVRGLPYVFAKGVLEDAGFAWKVKGKVEGYLANLVVKQTPKPGTLVVDTGFPIVVLGLEKNPDYEEHGLPEKTSPYKGTEVVLVSGDDPSTATSSGTSTEDEAAEAGGDGQATEEPAETDTEPASAADSDESYAAPDEETSTDADEAGAAADDGSDAAQARPAARPPAFVVPGAPPEPLDEIPLPLRAKRLLDRLHKAPALTAELRKHWQYQHAWIVTGARYGWWRGAEALRTLIRADEYVQERWGPGAKSEQIARAALAEVRAKSK